MTNPKDLLNDITQMAGGAAGLLGSASQQIRDEVKARVEDIADRMDLVPREDLERVEVQLEKALADQKDIISRLISLEEKLEKNK